MPHTPNDGTAETTAGKWPPRDRDPFDPACEGEKKPERAHETERSDEESS